MGHMGYIEVIWLILGLYGTYWIDWLSALLQAKDAVRAGCGSVHFRFLLFHAQPNMPGYASRRTLEYPQRLAAWETDNNGFLALEIYPILQDVVDI